MSKKNRQIKIELGRYDVVWNNSYILFHTMSFPEIKKMQKEVQVLTKGQKKVERELKKLQYTIDEEEKKGNFEGKVFDEYYKEEKLGDELAEALIEFMLKIMRNHFISGKIFDKVSNTLVDITKQTLEEYLDSEMIKEIVARIGGSVEKKD